MSAPLFVLNLLTEIHHSRLIAGLIHRIAHDVVGAGNDEQALWPTAYLS